MEPFAAKRIWLERAADGASLKSSSGAVVKVDHHLLGHPRRGSDLLWRAVLAGPGRVVDATAGLGSDAFHLAAKGARVTMIERSPMLAELLADAIERARAGQWGEAAQRSAQRLDLVVGDSREVLVSGALGGDVAVVFLDPMFPQRGKGALPAKGIALLRQLLARPDEEPAAGPQEAAGVGLAAKAVEEAELLAAAISGALRRVVVKRPVRAGPLAGVRPSGELRGSTTRYDLYPGGAGEVSR